MTATAACAGVDTDLFFSDDQDRRNSGRRRATGLAAKYCAICPIRKACDAEADRRQEPGLWGGSWRVRDNRAYRKTPLLPYLPNYDKKAG